MTTSTAPVLLVQHCLSQDYDAATGVCAAPFWSAQSGGLPPLSVVDGLAISAAIGGCWAIGFVIKSARKPLEDNS